MEGNQTLVRGKVGEGNAFYRSERVGTPIESWVGAGWGNPTLPERKGKPICTMSFWLAMISDSKEGTGASIL